MRFNKNIMNTKKKIFEKIFLAMAFAFIAFMFWPLQNSSHVYIHGVHVGGLNAAEANAVLMQHFQPALDVLVITYTLDGVNMGEFTFADFGTVFDFSPLVGEALEYGAARRPRLLQFVSGVRNFDGIVSLVTSPDMVREHFAKLEDLVRQDAKDATFIVEQGVIVVRPDVTGRSLDTALAITDTQAVIESLASGEVVLQITTMAAKYTTSDFTFKVSTLGTFVTLYTGGENEPRVYNVRLAASRVHNQVIQPGQVFSAGQVIAAHKPDTGYKEAVVLVNGEPTYDVGGGVCQVVSTLYNAVLAAELTVVQRHNHSAPVSYVERGFDATVAGDYYDLKFKNCTPHPIIIATTMQAGELRVTIYGYDSRPKERSIRFSVRRVELVQPGPYREIVDPSIPRGERQLVLASQMGYHVELIKHVYMHGEQVEEIKINASVYKALPGVVAIGTG